jgi:hypothetical protein
VYSSSYYCSRDKSSFEVCLNSAIMSNSWCIVALTIVAVINLVTPAVTHYNTVETYLETRFITATIVRATIHQLLLIIALFKHTSKLDLSRLTIVAVINLVSRYV